MTTSCARAGLQRAKNKMPERRIRMLRHSPSKRSTDLSFKGTAPLRPHPNLPPSRKGGCEAVHNYIIFRGTQASGCRASTLRCVRTRLAHRDRCRCPDFASAFRALRKSADHRQEPATTRLTRIRTSARSRASSSTSNSERFRSAPRTCDGSAATWDAVSSLRGFVVALPDGRKTHVPHETTRRQGLSRA